MGFPGQDAAKAEDLFPQKEGFRWVYVSGAAEATVTIAGQEKVGDVECLVVATERKGREFLHVGADGIFVHRVEQGKTIEDFAPPLPRLKGGTKKGDTWEWKGKLGAQELSAKYANEGVVDVKVAAGAFKAWKVSATMTVAGGTMAQSLWYAPGVGLVLQETEWHVGDRKQTTRLELKSYEAPK